MVFVGRWFNKYVVVWKLGSTNMWWCGNSLPNTVVAWSLETVKCEKCC
jgi:hypothetical protein